MPEIESEFLPLPRAAAQGDVTGWAGAYRRV